MNVDAFTKGLKRATAQRKQQQAKAVVNIPTKPATQPQAEEPAFGLEAYRLDIISKAIAHITKQKGATA